MVIITFGAQEEVNFQMRHDKNGYRGRTVNALSTE